MSMRARLLAAQKVPSVPGAAQPLMLRTGSDGRNGELTAGSAGTAVFPAPIREQVIAVVGDSITEGAQGSFRLTKTAAGYKNQSAWLSPGPSTSGMTNLNVPGYTLQFIDKCQPNLECVKNDAWTIAYDGVSSIRVSIAGEGFGAPVDVSTGGWFTAYSAGGVKALHFTIRWDWRPPSAAQNSGTLASTLTVQATGTSMGSWAALALAAKGFKNRSVYHFGITSDPVNVILRRSVQVAEGLRPDVVFIMASINNFPSMDIRDLVALVRLFNSIGSRVIVSTLLPLGTTTTDTAKQLAAINKKIINLSADYPDLRCEIVDLFALAVNPRATSGAGLVAVAHEWADLLHPSWAAIMRWAPAMRSKIEHVVPTRAPTVSSGIDIYDATYNPRGNCMGSLGNFAGTTGTKTAVYPAATGSVPAAWEDLDGGTTAGNSWASVVYTSPDDASPVPRTDGLPGSWSRIVCSTAGAAGSSRSFRCAPAAGNFVAGGAYKMSGALRVSNASFLKILNVQAYYYSTSGRAVQQFLLANIGFAAQGINAAIADTGALYLESDIVNIPNDFTGLAYVTVSLTCGAGGSVTLDLADFKIDPV